MDARELRDKLAAKETALRHKEFLAPFDETSRKANVKVDGVIYPFRIVGQTGSGFGIFKPVDGSCARFVREAPFEMVRSFLGILPKLHFILAYETDRGWIAQPMNRESASKSLGLESEALVKNVTDCERFDVVVARFDGSNFWFDEVFMGGDLSKAAAMRECFRKDRTPRQMKLDLAKIKGMSPEDLKAFDLAVVSWAEFRKLSTEAALRKVLGDSGGKLGSYVIRGANIEVRWTTESGRSYTSVVKKDSFDVVSAGICLSGGDKQFHLKDLPYIMKQGEDRNAIFRTALERDWADEHSRDLDYGDEDD